MVDDLEVICDCGWTARGPEDQLIQQIQQHARDAHRLEVTREQALAQTRPASTK
jgi:predicted small metal-binding protein